ncbi:hypothetical protein B0A50_00497 [Salinomyces thailandicus]|uniref:Uncharacterized protein n=1 Tax=Salinomyces thailandicus TaxID=706561 RepID=A0A4U0UDR4_9PEZI|nr:hypothetical protein B0A50_00497 [Salinomyces thailandica]
MMLGSRPHPLLALNADVLEQHQPTHFREFIAFSTTISTLKKSSITPKACETVARAPWTPVEVIHKRQQVKALHLYNKPSFHRQKYAADPSKFGNILLKDAKFLQISWSSV